MLDDYGLLRGDFPLFNSYIGKNGPTDDADDLGEAVPDVNTCTDQLESKAMYAIQSKMPEGNMTIPFNDVTSYIAGCGKRLKVRVKQGYSGSVMLAVQATSTSTSTSTDPADDSAAGYVAISKSLLPVMIEAVVTPLEPTDFALNSQVQYPPAQEGGTLTLGRLGSNTSIDLSRYSTSTRYAIDLLDVTTTMDTVTDTFAIEKDTRLIVF